MKYNELEAAGYKLHHKALFRGYVSRKGTYEPRTEEYTGRFGTGYRAELPNLRSRRYSFVEYWVK